ncbi:MAG: hypothetical protein NVS3B2_03110 [Ramlibacter sp.]
MWLAAAGVREGSASIRPYKVGTPMNTVASAIFAITSFGSNFASHSILLPLISAPWMATNNPCTWKIGSAWISTSSGTHPQESLSTRAFDSRLPCVSIAPLLRPVVPLV